MSAEVVEEEGITAAALEYIARRLSGTQRRALWDAYAGRGALWGNAHTVRSLLAGPVPLAERDAGGGEYLTPLGEAVGRFLEESGYRKID